MRYLYWVMGDPMHFINSSQLNIQDEYLINLNKNDAIVNKQEKNYDTRY